MSRCSLLFFLATFLFISKGVADSQDGLEISVSANMIYEQGLSEESEALDQLTMREAEITFFAPVDHMFEGFLSASSHEENGQSNFELHELYLKSSQVIPNSSVKVGQFFLGIGRLNRFHLHEWPFPRAPLVHRNFFDDEGVFDAGLEFSRFLPFEQIIQLTLGLTSGRKFGHSHTSGPKPKTPTHYLRFSFFHEMSSTNGLDLGLNYLSRIDSESTEIQLIGLDFAAKWREGSFLRHLVQSEIWVNRSEDEEESLTEQIGLYSFYQYGLNQLWSLALRLDAYKDLTLRDTPTGPKINNISYGLLSQASYQVSEFSLFRPGLSHEFERREGRTTFKDTRFELQFLFFFGGHPAHDF